MSRTTWQIEKKSGGSWISDGTIYAPNADFPYSEISTQKKIQLADGDIGYITPSTKYNKSPLVFIWYNIDNTFANKIEDYVENATDLKITDGMSGKVYYGRFINIERKEIVGIETYYDLRAEFEQMDGLA